MKSRCHNSWHRGKRNVDYNRDIVLRYKGTVAKGPIQSSPSFSTTPPSLCPVVPPWEDQGWAQRETIETYYQRMVLAVQSQVCHSELLLRIFVFNHVQWNRLICLEEGRRAGSTWLMLGAYVEDSELHGFGNLIRRTIRSDLYDGSGCNET